MTPSFPRDGVSGKPGVVQRRTIPWDPIERGTGQHLGKRQVEDLVGRAAVDFDAFYRQRTPPSSDPDDVLALSCDGKGVVMRPDALRPATAKAAANTNPKLATRLSKGERRNRKRMAVMRNSSLRP